MLEVRFSREDEVEAVRRFLAEAGYAGGVGAGERAVVAEHDGVLVGAYRLAQEHGCLVLRGMRVREGSRRCGIGSRMLGMLSELERTCYCIPYRHLAGFYARAGFEILPQGGAPAFLAARAREYAGRGLDVLVMEREPRGGPAQLLTPFPREDAWGRRRVPGASRDR
jgi:GNAT superfamily N-acetyltransferase